MTPSDLASSASSLLPAAQPTVIQQLEQLLTDAHRLEASAASPPSSPSSSSDYLHGPTRIENVHDQSSVAVMSILIAICGFAIFFPLNLVLFPLTCVEWFLRYQITFEGGSSQP